MEHQTHHKAAAQPVSHVLGDPTVTKEGVLFTVTSLEYTRHACLISTDALATLSLHRSADMVPMDVFRAYEAKICGVARRLIAARVQGSPLLLHARSFH